MKKIIALSGIALLIFSLVPFASAEIASANTSTDAQAVSVTSLKVKKLGEAFSDFVFTLKAAFAFSQDAKLELLKKRNEELRARQQEWLGVKANILSKFNSSISTEQKQELMAEIQAEHMAIIEDHLAATAEIRAIQINAKSAGKADIETKAEASANAAENSKVSLGLSVPVSLSSKVSAKTDAKAKLTAEKARIIVMKQFGFESRYVRAETKNGIEFYVVAGNDIEIAGDYALTKEFEVWVNAETGIISSVDMSTSIESRADAEAKAKISSKADVGASGSVGIRAESEADSDTSSEAKAKASVRVGVN